MSQVVVFAVDREVTDESEVMTGFQELGTFPELITDPKVLAADDDVGSDLVDDVRNALDTKTVRNINCASRMNLVRMLVRGAIIVDT